MSKVSVTVEIKENNTIGITTNIKGQISCLELRGVKDMISESLSSQIIELENQEFSKSREISEISDKKE